MESLEQSLNEGLISYMKMMVQPSVGLFYREDDSDSDSSGKNTKAIIYESATKSKELEKTLSNMGYNEEEQKQLQKTCEKYGPMIISPSAGIFPLFPPYDILIKEAIAALGGGKGARRKAIIKWIASKEKYLTKSSCTKGVGLALKRMTRSGFLYHSVRGTYLMTPKGKLLSYTKGKKFNRKVCFEKSQKSSKKKRSAIKKRKVSKCAPKRRKVNKRAPKRRKVNKRAPKRRKVNKCAPKRRKVIKCEKKKVKRNRC